MISEIYMRDPSDPLYRPNVLDVSNDLEVLLGQIRMILFTRPTDVIGSPSFGTNLEYYIFSTNVSNSQIERIVREQIYQNCPQASKFSVNVEVRFFYGSTRDMCVIDIFVDGTKYLGIALK